VTTSFRRHSHLITLCGLIFLVYLLTLAPTIATLFDDSLEFQLVAFQPGIAHPTGYPLYTLLGKLFTWLPVGDVAYRVNLLSAVAATLAVGGLVALLRQVGLGWVASVTGAVAFGLSRTFWTQATIAEVYTLHALFVVLILLATLYLRANGTANRRAWLIWVFLLGLSLTHHRTILLLWPALLLYLWLTRSPERGTQRPSWLALAGAFLLPLLLYLYIPIRGLTISSLDGSYDNTLSGFLRWITASGYGTFFADNPLSPHYGVANYLSLFGQQFGPVGWLLTVPGLLLAWRRRPQATALFLVAGLTGFAFGLAYRVPDVAVFFIPVFLVAAIFIGWGVQALVDWTTPRGAVRGLVIGGGLIALLFTAWQTWLPAYHAANRSGQWAVYDDGREIITQPLPHGAVIIGILGEMTRLRYFQQVEGLRPDLRTVAADREADRRATVRAHLAAGENVYLTRPLPGIEKEFSLAAEGPLIRVPKTVLTGPPDNAVRIGRPISVDILLLAYHTEWQSRHDGKRLRLTLYWKTTAQITASLKVSARLLDDAGKMIAQRDGIPVHNAYPTTAWRIGEVIPDVYELPLPAKQVTPRRALVIIYDPTDLHEVGRLEWPLRK
jgi:hypothetical protein